MSTKENELRRVDMKAEQNVKIKKTERLKKKKRHKSCLELTKDDSWAKDMEKNSSVFRLKCLQHIVSYTLACSISGINAAMII